jgi:hypothetical protein
MGKSCSAAGARSALVILGVALIAALAAGLLLNDSDASSHGLSGKPRSSSTVTAPSPVKSARPRISLTVPAVGEAESSITATGSVGGTEGGAKVLLQRRAVGAWRAVARGVVRARRFRLSFLPPSDQPSLSVRAVLLDEGRQAAVSTVKSIRVRAAAGGGSPHAPKYASPGSQSTAPMLPPSTQPALARPEAPASPEPETEPEPQTTTLSYWGAWIGGQFTGTEAPFDMNAITDFEQLAEKPLSLINFSSPFANCPSSTSPSTSCTFYSFPQHEMETIRAYGGIPFFSWASDALPVSTSEPEFQFSDLIEGKFDTFIRRFATEAREWGLPFFLRFNWEMNGNWFPWTERTNGNSPGQYIEAWKHVHDIFEEVGADNASWVWCPYVDPNATLQSLSALYPGNEYVNWTCLDGYNWGPSAEPPRNWRSFSYLFGPTYRQITESIAPSKPMLIGETASSEIGGSKPEWIEAMFEALRTEFPRIQGLLWFEKEESGMDWPIETSESARNAFTAGIGEERFLGNSFASTSSDPIPAP